MTTTLIIASVAGIATFVAGILNLLRLTKARQQLLERVRRRRMVPVGSGLYRMENGNADEA